MKHKKQHFVPQCYLKAWCDTATPEGQEPYVWQFSKDGSRVRKKSPANIFYEKELYTIKNINGARDLRFEHGLCELESRFVKLRDNKISKKIPLTEKEHFLICIIITAMHIRNTKTRDTWKEFWSGAIKTGEKMMEWAKTASPEQLKAAASISPLQNESKGISLERAKSIESSPMQTLIPSIARLAPLIYKTKKDLLILETNDTSFFITSDHPCVWFDPESCKRPPFWQSPALMYSTTEIRFPVSPKQMIILNQQGHKGYYLAKEATVDDMNRITRFSSSEYFIVNKNIKKEIWFDPGVESSDSWRNQQKKHKI